MTMQDLKLFDQRQIRTVWDEEQTGKRVVTSLNMKQYLEAQQPTLGLEQDAEE